MEIEGYEGFAELLTKVLAVGGGWGAATGAFSSIPLVPIALTLLGTVVLVTGCVVAVSYLNNRRKIEVAKLQQLQDKDGKDKFFLQSCAGMIVSSELNSECQLTATRTQAQEWEYFEIIRFEDGKIAFRASNEKFVSVDQDRDGLLVANKEKLSDLGLFLVEEHGEYSAFKASTGKYVSRREDLGCILSASVDKAQGWELFRILKKAAQENVLTS